MEYSPKKMQEMLERNGFNLKKKFGQNFIVDENIINGIMTKSEIDKDTLVIEIGPGAGSLTYKLSGGNHKTAKDTSKAVRQRRKKGTLAKGEASRLKTVI